MPDGTDHDRNIIFRHEQDFCIPGRIKNPPSGMSRCQARYSTVPGLMRVSVQGSLCGYILSSFHVLRNGSRRHARVVQYLVHRFDQLLKLSLHRIQAGGNLLLVIGIGGRRFFVIRLTETTLIFQGWRLNADGVKWIRSSSTYSIELSTILPSNFFVAYFCMTIS